MREYTTMTHACMAKQHASGVDFKECEGEANNFLQQCNHDQLAGLPENHMAAHYFHMTPPSQWSPMGLAHHKWNLRKPAQWGKKSYDFDHKMKQWEAMKPTSNVMVYKKPFEDAKALYNVDKFEMEATPYSPDSDTNTNVVNVNLSGLENLELETPEDVEELAYPEDAPEDLDELFEDEAEDVEELPETEDQSADDFEDLFFEDDAADAEDVEELFEDDGDDMEEAKWAELNNASLMNLDWAPIDKEFEDAKKLSM